MAKNIFDKMALKANRMQNGAIARENRFIRSEERRMANDASSSLDTDKESKFDISKVLGAAQAIGGIASDLSNNKPDALKPKSSAILNTAVSETRIATESIASKLLSDASARADKDYAAASAKVRRESGGNAALAIMGMNNANQIGLENYRLAADKSADVMLAGQQMINDLKSKIANDVANVDAINSQNDKEYYLQSKAAASDLIGAGLNNVIDSFEYDKFKKAEDKVKKDNELFPIGKNPKDEKRESKKESDVKAKGKRPSILDDPRLKRDKGV